MLVAIMTMAVVLESPTSSDPASLVARLGSPHYASRIEAEEELARLGRMALPALRSAKDSKDFEMRTRAFGLLARIEGASMLEATPIGLDLRDLPLTQAVELIGRQAGMRLSLPPEERPILANRRITLRSDGPLTFWQAIDALCSAGALHPAQLEADSMDRLEASLVLRDGQAGRSGLVSDSGAFRVQLSSLFYRSEIQLGRPREMEQSKDETRTISHAINRPTGRSKREFFAQLVLSSEPRLSMSRNGPIQVMVAVDDLGHDLRRVVAPRDARFSQGFQGMNPASVLGLSLELGYPDVPCGRIKVIKGSIPVMVTARKSEPLVIPLDDSKGKLFRNDEAALVLIDHRPPSSGQPATIKLAVRPLGDSAEPIELGVGEPLAYRPDSLQQQLEVLDAEGEPLPWFPSNSFYDGEETRLTITIRARGKTAAPTTLRYHSIHKTSADVTFEFRDIPMP